MIDQDFRPLLHGFDLDELESDASTIVGVWPDHRLAYTNGAWTRFALANGAPSLDRDWPLGRNLLEAIPGPLVAFYAAGVHWTMTQRAPWTHQYECSSPALFRLFHLELLPLALDETAPIGGLLYVHSLRVEEPWEANAPAAPDPAEYTATSGAVTSCAHCRRFRRGPSREGEEWVFIPSWLTAPPAPVSHGICGPCAAYHFYQQAHLARRS